MKNNFIDLLNCPCCKSNGGNLIKLKKKNIDEILELNNKYEEKIKNTIISFKENK